MALSVQNDDGTVADANAYITLAYFRSYHLSLGRDTATNLDPAVEAAIARATMFLDARHRFIGERKNLGQLTQWPRINVYNNENRAVYGIPEAVRRATAEYALRALVQDLMPDPTREVSGRKIRSFTNVIGPITQTKNYGDYGNSYDMPLYPLADNLLRQEGFLVQTRRTLRA